MPGPKDVKTLRLDSVPSHDSQVSDYFSKWGSPSRFFGAETVGISYVEIEPGEEGPMHAHEEPIEEFYVILEGNLDIDVLDPETNEVETFELTTGQMAYFPPGVYKKPVNRSDQRAIELRFGSLSSEGETVTKVAEEH